MATRGRTPGVYTTDGGTDYMMQVDKDRFADASFGWAAPTGVLPKLPRGLKPRHVNGVDTTGARGRAVVPVLTATIWTGADTTFSIEGDDQVVYTATVTSRYAEKPSLP